MTSKASRLYRIGRLAQLVRALPSHGRGQRFKSFVAHHSSRAALSFHFGTNPFGESKTRQKCAQSVVVSLGEWRQAMLVFIASSSVHMTILYPDPDDSRPV